MKKKSIALLALILILTITAGSTLAWLFATTGKVTNTFDLAHVDTKIEEVINGGVKEKVSVKNTGDIEAFIRAAVVLNLLDDDGNIVAGTPELTLVPETGWVKDGGYYYYTSPVAAGSSVPLFTNVEANAKVQMTILAEAIQADPIDAVKDAWGNANPCVPKA